MTSVIMLLITYTKVVNFKQITTDLRRDPCQGELLITYTKVVNFKQITTI